MIVRRHLSMLKPVVVCTAVLTLAVAHAGQPSTRRTTQAVTTKAAGTIDVITHVLETLSATYQGTPHTLNWYLYSEGDSRPPDTTHPSLATIEIDIATAGRYTLDLDALYSHEDESNLGFDYVASDQATIIARSIDAVLQAVPESVSTVESVTLDGSGSDWGPGVTPTFEWDLVSLGGTPFTACASGQAQQPSDVQCVLEAITLPPDTYTMTLTLTDPSSPEPYNSDAHQAEFTVFELVPLSIDFTWSPVDPQPDQMVTFDLDVTPPEAETDLTQVTWDFGDGAQPETINCGLWPCSGITHIYSTDGWYTVDVTAETVSELATATHEVKIGDPATPPNAAFTASPATPNVLDTVTFALDTACTGSCAYAWAFGDGATAVSAAPSHAYSVPDTYTVTLTVTNQAGNDSTAQQLTVANCWTAPAPLPDRTCYGAEITLTAAAGSGYLWFSGASTPWVTVTQAGAYWVDVNSGGGCWGYSSLDLVLQSCGDPGGDANLDGSVDGGDPSALISELTDGDGNEVPASGGGDLLAPGGDCTDPTAGPPDGLITVDDLLGVIDALFASS